MCGEFIRLFIINLKKYRKRVRGMVAESFTCCRREAGLSLDEAAIRTKMPVAALVRFERGEAEPDALALKRMAQAYGCTCDELLGINWEGSGPRA